MAKTLSTMLELGTAAPSFTLPDTVSGSDLSLSDFEGSPILVAFICAHCPFVVHLQDELARMGNDYADSALNMVAISSNSIETHPADAPDKLAEQAKNIGFTFPYLYDESQDVAKAYTAACTPDFFLFDANHKLVYRGQLDESRPNAGTADGKDLRKAIDQLLAGEEIFSEQMPSVGCNIKWHPGKEPDYFG